MSPSGVHLGHYKALISRHAHSLVQDDDDTTENDVKLTEIRDELNHMQQAIRQLHLQLIHYALERGYSFQRWQKVAYTILFKEPENIKIQSEVKRLLHDGQFGSRPRRNAIDPVMLEELQFEVSRAAHKVFLQLEYDATACYDRIIPNLAMVAS